MVSTNVVEVGVNVPEATVMIIESAERFGLAQLHQLRGRVCRSTYQPYCFLITSDNLGTEAYQRINVILQSTDGFEIAEKDLELRGPGDLLGVEQSGIFEMFRLAKLPGDSDLLNIARQDAEELLKLDPNLSGYPWLKEAIVRLRKGKPFWQSVA